MTTYVWLLINSIGILSLALIQYLSVRQIGIMLTRLGPVGARSDDGEGPRKGEFISKQLHAIRNGALDTQEIDELYLFGSYRCSICKEIRQSAAELSRHWAHQVRIFMIYDEEPSLAVDGSLADASSHDYSLEILHNGLSVRESFDIQGVPYGIRVDRFGCVLGKGLVNSIGHIESLLELEAEPASGVELVDREVREFTNTHA